MLKDANEAVRIFLKYFAEFWIYPVIFGNKTIKMFNFEFSSGKDSFCSSVSPTFKRNPPRIFLHFSSPAAALECPRYLETKRLEDVVTLDYHMAHEICV